MNKKDKENLLLEVYQKHQNDLIERMKGNSPNENAIEKEFTELRDKFESKEEFDNWREDFDKLKYILERGN